MSFSIALKFIYSCMRGGKWCSYPSRPSPPPEKEKKLEKNTLMAGLIKSKPREKRSFSDCVPASTQCIEWSETKQTQTRALTMLSFFLFFYLWARRWSCHTKGSKEGGGAWIGWGGGWGAERRHQLAKHVCSVQYSWEAEAFMWPVTASAGAGHRHRGLWLCKNKSNK